MCRFPTAFQSCPMIIHFLHLMAILHSLLVFLVGSLLPLYHCSANIQLVCQDKVTYTLGGIVQGTAQSLAKRGFGPSCPCAYDKNGVCRQSPHMCTASNSTFLCGFSMKNFIVSEKGGLFEEGSDTQVLFGDNSMCGPHPPVYATNIFNDWNAVIQGYRNSHHRKTGLPEYDLVVPVRMNWDDCFNHLTFQLLPLAGLVLEFYPELWDKITWQTSKHAGAMMNLMGVPWERIVMEKPLKARNILLPWIPHWNPVQLSSIHGISGRASDMITRTLISKEFVTALRAPAKLSLYSLTHPNDTAESLSSFGSRNDTTGPFRYVVYISRKDAKTRDVWREDRVLDAIAGIIDKSRYKLVVLGHTDSYDTPEELQQSWQRFARVAAKAVVLVGPHGGAWNNLLFTPSDCHYIEINHFPDDPRWIDGTSQVRHPFLTGAWAKGGSGKFYNIEPNDLNNRAKPDFYGARLMTLAIPDLVQIFTLINAEVPGSNLLMPFVSPANYTNNAPQDRDDLAAKRERFRQEMLAKKRGGGGHGKPHKAVPPNVGGGAAASLNGGGPIRHHGIPGAKSAPGVVKQ